MRVAFLFGSGISIPAGMPSTQEITQQILAGEGSIRRHSNGTYDFDHPVSDDFALQDDSVSQVITLLKRLKSEVDQYYHIAEDQRQTNYEDLYYVTTQIHDSESGNYDNPVVQPFIEKALPDVKELWMQREYGHRNNPSLIALTQEAMNYVSDTVWNMLDKESIENCHLKSIMNACIDDQIATVDLFTLNHDTVLDKLLRQFLLERNMAPNDGFGRPINGVRYWEPDLFDSVPSKVRLFKLHGSIDWFRFRPNNGTWYDELVGIPSNQDAWHTRNPSNQAQYPIDGRPLILIGTFNKMLQYTTSGIFAFLNCQFHCSLRRTQYLVISGYGFGDKGINSAITNWIYSSSDHRIIVIHHDPTQLMNNARAAIRHKWRDLENRNVLKAIPKRIEEVDWQEIKDGLLEK